MPRRDATGPNGDGSGTGRGLGNCCGVNGLGLNKFNRLGSSQNEKSEMKKEQELLKMRLEELEKRLDSL